MTSGSCLVLIDLQNEFLSPEGHFPIHDASRQFLSQLPALVAAFRTCGKPIVWVRSEYGITIQKGISQGSRGAVEMTIPNSPSGTHSSQTPCCESGSFGAEFPEYIASLITTSESPPASENIVITKTWYSAFKGTTLFVELKNRGITQLFVGGLLSNVCVNATVLDACNLGFDVTVLEDCLGFRKHPSHERALNEMLKYGAQIASSRDFDDELNISIIHLPRLYYVNGSIPSWRVMMALYEKDVRFQPIRLRVMINPKETRQPGFLAVNHRGKAPVFVDVLPPRVPPGADELHSGPETLTINESLAILTYIETYHDPSRPLLPPVSERVSRAVALARMQETENLRDVYDVLEHAHFEAEHLEASLSGTERARLAEAVHTELDFWEVYAERTKYIAGDEFGLVDCAFFPLLAYMVHRGFDWRRAKQDTPNYRGAGLPCVTSEPKEVEAWPYLKAYFDRVWMRGGKNGCAQMAQPVGWTRRGKANVWKGTKGNAKGIYKGHDSPTSNNLRKWAQKRPDSDNRGRKPALVDVDPK